MQIKKDIPKRRYFTLGLLGFFLFLIIWFLLTYTGIVKEFFLPSPIKVLQSTARLFIESNLFSDIVISIYRIAVGFFLASIIAIPLGILAGSVKSIEAFLEPLVAFIRYIPPSAFVPLSILWLGVGDTEKFFIIFIGVTPYLLLLVASTVVKVKNELIEAGYTLGATTKQIFTRIIIPNSLPGIWDSMRLMIGAAWTFIILAEIIASSSGLGHVIIQSQRFLQTSNIIAVIIIIGFLGLITDYAFKACSKKFFPWLERAR